MNLRERLTEPLLHERYFEQVPKLSPMKVKQLFQRGKQTVVFDTNVLCSWEEILKSQGNFIESAEEIINSNLHMLYGQIKYSNLLIQDDRLFVPCATYKEFKKCYSYFMKAFKRFKRSVPYSFDSTRVHLEKILEERKTFSSLIGTKQIECDDETYRFIESNNFIPEYTIRNRNGVLRTKTPSFEDAQLVVLGNLLSRTNTNYILTGDMDVLVQKGRSQIYIPKLRRDSKGRDRPHTFMRHRQVRHS